MRHNTSMSSATHLVLLRFFFGFLRSGNGRRRSRSGLDPVALGTLRRDFVQRFFATLRDGVVGALRLCINFLQLRMLDLQRGNEHVNVVTSSGVVKKYTEVGVKA